MTKYTYTFDRESESKFRSVLSRLDPSEYSVIEDVKLVDPDNVRYSKRQTTIEMESEACLTIRMAMGNTVKIRRERSEEELATEAERDARHTVTIKVQVPGMPALLHK
jgi:hypothetical protein